MNGCMLKNERKKKKRDFICQLNVYTSMKFYKYQEKFLMTDWKKKVTDTLNNSCHIYICNDKVHGSFLI